MTTDFSEFVASERSRFQKLSEKTFNTRASGDLHRLREASHYAFTAGGKRLRPILAVAAARAVGTDSDIPGLEECQVALELIHTYSLIHDDLPAMDDDDLRRGIPTLHKAFDEATAILVGDGLQAKAFELLAHAPGVSPERRVAMITVLAKAAGADGMVGGQFIDIQAKGSVLNLDALQTMHSLKTGALIRASLALGAIAARGDDSQLQALDNYGAHIGLAFQVVDDILDVEGDTATLGKTRGKDDHSAKPTYVTILGLDESKKEAQRLLEQAISCLAPFGDQASRLRELAHYIVNRDR